ncbi:MAG: hypothetical protein WC202_05025 [Desulfobacterales bacterium]
MHDPIKTFLLEDARRFSGPALDGPFTLKHLRKMRDFWTDTLTAFNTQNLELFELREQFIALAGERATDPGNDDDAGDLAETIFNDGNLIETLKYLLAENAEPPTPKIDGNGHVINFIEFQICIDCMFIFYAIWAETVESGCAEYPPALGYHMAAVSFDLARAAWLIMGNHKNAMRYKSVLESQKTRKAAAKDNEKSLFEAICKKKPVWFTRYGASMTSIALDLIKETGIDRTPKQVVKYIRDGLSRGGFANTGLEEALREIYCKIPKKGNSL